MLKIKNLKSIKRKQLVTYKGVPIRLSADFSKETLQGRMGWHEILKVMKKQGPTAKIILPSKAIT